MKVWISLQLKTVLQYLSVRSTNSEAGMVLYLDPLHIDADLRDYQIKICFTES